MDKNQTTYRVIYGDTDQMGVVYYANYLRWFEKGRTEYLREAGMPYSSIEQRGICFPVIEVSGRYLRPAHFDDEILIETILDSLSGTILKFNYKINHHSNGSLLTLGWTKHACVNRQGQVTKIPTELVKLLKDSLSTKTSDFGGNTM